jgi:undecaprenyl-diphosphatase
MNWWQAIVLGVVEGVTEFLPVSSTGHLLLFQRLLGIPADQASKAVAICIQAGAIIAVLGIFRHRLGQMVRGLTGSLRLSASRPEETALVRNLLIAFLPALVLGFAFSDWIDEHLLRLWPVTIAWIVGGLAILLVERWRIRSRDRSAGGRAVDQMTWHIALGIGLMQTIAICPGTSRSLVTILGGLLLGMSLSAAVEFSFLLGVITLLAATIFRAATSGPAMLQAYPTGTLIVAGLAACVSAFIAVRWMIAYLNRRPMTIFAYYRIVLGLVVACCLSAGWLSE